MEEVMKLRDRMIMTEKASQMFNKPHRGILISIKDPYVYILRDGLKTIVKYHKSFWEKDDGL